MVLSLVLWAQISGLEGVAGWSHWGRGLDSKGRYLDLTF